MENKIFKTIGIIILFLCSFQLSIYIANYVSVWLSFVAMGVIIIAIYFIIKSIFKNEKSNKN